MQHSIIESEVIQLRRGNPLEHCRQWLETDQAGPGLLLVQFTHQSHWLEGSPEESLTAIYLRDGGALCVSVTNASLSEGGLPPIEQYATWALEHQFVRHRCGNPVSLSPLCIPKPWGQEIWYTGVEERGVCSFSSDEGSTPIPWMQSVTPGGELGMPGQALVLLKILDPVATPVIGDLYFELHEEKQEVYVVTAVDASAWPDGTGYIRMGFSPRKLETYAGDPDAFRQAYLDAVQCYESVRRQIDGLPEGEEADDVLLKQEASLRQEMDSYSNLRPLAVGDVVKVPLLTPHSLQHGVRTVEFQTPVYERKILSFAQRVLTQDHWDTEEAVAAMTLDQQPAADFEVLKSGEGIAVERIVDFSDFEVRRVRITGSASYRFNAGERYAVAMVVEGSLRLDGGLYGPEQAMILPADWEGVLGSAQPASPLVFLLALPRD